MRERPKVKFWFPELSNVSDKAEIGDGTVIHAGVQIHDEVKIGKFCLIEALVFIPNGVTIEDGVFVGPHVCFTNDPTLIPFGKTFVPTPTRIRKGVRIGANSSILAGITIGEGAIIGMGSVVLSDVPAYETWVGNPARCVVKPMARMFAHEHDE